METGICPECNNPIQPGWAFCDNCGRSLSSTPADPAPQKVKQIQPLHRPLPAANRLRSPGSARTVAQTMPPVQGSVSDAGCSSSQLRRRSSLPTGEAARNAVYTTLPRRSSASNAAHRSGLFPPRTTHRHPSLPQNWPPTLKVDQPPAGFLTGSLVIQKSNISLLMPQGSAEAILGREDPASNIYPEINLEPHGGHEAGVGRQHARLVINGGQLCLVDLNSVNGSYINRKKDHPRSAAAHPGRRRDPPGSHDIDLSRG